ncbi:hypothetical protein cypCar_00025065 [Cyprinus carpio]|nr:hypothetical protein cypCar_00025065 [Cyprinus carpio]
MLNWFEISSENLKGQHKPPRDAMNLIEVFYEVAMGLCHITIAGSNKILDIFLLRFGAVVLDYEVAFCLRLELFKPEDEFLKEFWVDFNIGTSTISFFVNDPKNTLWELIHLPKDVVSVYNFQVLPLSSPSSNEEFSKYSTPKQRLQGRGKMASKDWQSQVKLGRSLNMESSFFRESTADSGFQNKTLSETSLPLEEIDNLIEEHNLDKETSIPQKSEAGELSELYVGLKEDTQLHRHPTFQPRRLFMSSPLEDAAERVTEAFADEESEEELGAGVRAAFNSFKTQLRAHFTSRYKKIEARSLQSLTDCQRNVTSLLGTVHNQRLVHLEQFQNTVVQQLTCLEQDCLSLKTIEKETVVCLNFSIKWAHCNIK